MSERSGFRLRNQDEAGNPNRMQELFAAETVKIADHFKGVAWDGDDAPIEAARYISRTFHDLEVEKLWSKAWQLACRDEDILKAGDCYVYDIGDRSVIMVRGHDGEVRAFYNSCLHRGRALRDGPGNASELRCPFHGFAWSLEGAFKSLPCAWDFKHLDADALRLPQVRCERWNGFVFICFDEDAAPLTKFLGVLPEHFADYGLERSTTILQIRKRIGCNWKIGQEAFFESLHSRTTHPHLITFIADVDSQYDAFGDNITRMITASGEPSSHVGGVAAEKVLRDTLGSSGRMAGMDLSQFRLPEGMGVREYIAGINRDRFGQASGRDLSQATVSELQDAILYSVFPNLQIWAGYFVNFVYRFIPDGNDPDTCVFDFRMLGRYHEGEECPTAPAPLVLDKTQSFTEHAPGIGPLAKILDQDMRNLPHMARGLKSNRDGKVQLAHYQELRIRHFHDRLDDFLGR